MRGFRAFCGIFLILISVLTSCGTQGRTQQRPKLTVVTSFYPMYILTKNVIGDLNDVRLVNMTESQTGCLHDYELLPADLKTLDGADVFVINGAGMETFLSKVAENFPKLKIVEASRGIQLLNRNPHIWVSIKGAIKETENIAFQLSAIDSLHAKQYKKNCNMYVKKLKQLDNTMVSALSNVRNRKIVTFHEAFPYFAKEFNLDIVSVIEREPGAEPNAGELRETIQTIENSGTRAIFAEPQYSPKAAQGISAETGVKIYPLDPFVTGPKNGSADSYEKVMKSNLQSLLAALK